jgi:hypothetical protein
MLSYCYTPLEACLYNAMSIAQVQLFACSDVIIATREQKKKRSFASSSFFFPSALEQQQQQCFIGCI